VKLARKFHSGAAFHPLNGRNLWHGGMHAVRQVGWTRGWTWNAACGGAGFGG
jgi:hypothetical protein